MEEFAQTTEEIDAEEEMSWCVSVSAKSSDCWPSSLAASGIGGSDDSRSAAVVFTNCDIANSSNIGSGDDTHQLISSSASISSVVCANSSITNSGISGDDMRTHFDCFLVLDA